MRMVEKSGPIDKNDPFKRYFIWAGRLEAWLIFSMGVMSGATIAFMVSVSAP